MSSGLTLGYARTNLPSPCFPPGQAASATLAAPYVNAATKWLMSQGRWRGTKQRVVFTAYDHQITLGREFLALLAANIQGTGDNCHLLQARYQVTNQWYQWIPGGPGMIVNPPYDIGRFVDQGDGFVIFRDLPSYGRVKVYTSATGETGNFNVRGFSVSQKVYTGLGAARIEGEDLVLPATVSSVTSTTSFDEGSSLYGIVKPITNGELTFYHVAADLTETLIGRYAPGETIPCYRRYWNPQPYCQDDDWQTVGLVKLKPYDVRVDNDVIVPGNMTALEMAMMAVQFRRKAEMERANEYMAMAVQELNAELVEFESEESYGVVSIEGGMGNANLV